MAEKLEYSFLRKDECNSNNVVLNLTSAVSVVGPSSCSAKRTQSKIFFDFKKYFNSGYNNNSSSGGSGSSIRLRHRSSSCDKTKKQGKTLKHGLISSAIMTNGLLVAPLHSTGQKAFETPTLLNFIGQQAFECREAMESISKLDHIDSELLENIIEKDSYLKGIHDFIRSEKNYLMQLYQMNIEPIRKFTSASAEDRTKLFNDFVNFRKKAFDRCRMLKLSLIEWVSSSSSSSSSRISSSSSSLSPLIIARSVFNDSLPLDTSRYYDELVHNIRLHEDLLKNSVDYNELCTYIAQHQYNNNTNRHQNQSLHHQQQQQDLNYHHRHHYHELSGVLTLPFNRLVVYISVLRSILHNISTSPPSSLSLSSSLSLLSSSSSSSSLPPSSSSLPLLSSSSSSSSSSNNNNIIIIIAFTIVISDNIIVISTRDTN
ncbi:hypothetical protein HELRODRAFT_192941 [Helobdella robusta]|uniref:DH domain-containing protein n=1 Tax=Helobdella robusta TaxID=6412 RepID=T1FUF9_HELRO|nr:hypothetical protein HELRODRAFT_192941 [Helobdella robusta]ESN98472.1 hypothetical protein HELRODRAFT_192941 [Helobdella robusta]